MSEQAIEELVCIASNENFYGRIVVKMLLTSTEGQLRDKQCFRKGWCRDHKEYLAEVPGEEKRSMHYIYE